VAIDAGIPMADEITKVTVGGIRASSLERRLFARLEEVPLAGLVQINAQRTDRSIFRVTSGGQSGYLYFEAGLLYSADFEASTGVPALALMLQLENGTLQSCEHAWPRTGNVLMDPVVALLQATNFRERGEPGSAPTASSEPMDIRTVDSMSVEAAELEDERDPLLASVTASFYGCCRQLASTLGLGRLDSGRLTDEHWIFLLFHDARSNRLSAALGARSPEPVATSRVGDKTADATNPLEPESLAELRANPGIMAILVADARGKLLALTHIGRLQPTQAAEASSLSAQALDCARDLGFVATTGELRFAGRRLVIVRSGDRCVVVLAVSSLAVQWLRELARRWAQALDANSISERSADAAEEIRPALERIDQSR
jgi:hypothetical protein